MTIIEFGDLLEAVLGFLFTPVGLALLASVAVSIALPSRRRRRSRYRSYAREPAFDAQPRKPRYRPFVARPPRRYDDEGLGDIRDLSPVQFERFVADLFRKRGYQAAVVGADGDHGIDIIVVNPQGDRELVQCKRWDRKWIGEPVVRDFYGAFMHDGQAVRGYIVTTSVFSDAAWAWAAGKPIDLIDGRQLAEAVRLIG